MRRRLLMIALDFPPAATSGALRLASFARHLPEHGWATSVVTIRRGFYGDDDGASQSSPPADCEVIRAFGFDTKAVLSWRGRYLGSLAFPDRAVSWIADGIRRALLVNRSRKIDAILSSSPAVSAHVVGFALKRITGLPWIADLRDPWNLNTPHGPRLRRIDRWLERRLLSAADRISVVTPGMAVDLERRHQDAVRSRIRLVPNGYDEPGMAAALAAAGRPARFNIIHLGSCLPPYRDPVPFLRAVRLCVDRGDLPASTSIELIGAPLDPQLLETVGRLRLEPQVRARPRLSHGEALTAAAGAALLLLLQTRPDHDLCVPVKTYEYLRTDRPILAVARGDGETAKLLRGLDGVTLVSPDDTEGIAAAIARLHREWAAGPARGFTREVQAHSRQRRAGEMAEVLDEMCAARGASVE